MTKLNQDFWAERYFTGNLGWDIGEVSLPIKTYADQLTNKGLKILIPGAGNAYEAEYFYNKGFKNIYVLDWAEKPLQNLKERVPGIPNEQLLCMDFFSLSDSFDLIIEQTFFSALTKDMRQKYADKMFELLKPGGKLVGLLFDDPLFDDHPPFGGNKKEYLPYFKNLFDIKVFDHCYNSIPPRMGRELFFIFQKTKDN
jgi:methyl halide transferase